MRSSQLAVWPAKVQFVPQPRLVVVVVVMVVIVVVVVVAVVVVSVVVVDVFVVVVAVAVVFAVLVDGQPRSSCSQHHCFHSEDHTFSQSS